MTFEEWLRTQIELRAEPSIRLGQSQDGTEASFMSWSDKSDGTWFWRVVGPTVELIQYISSDDT